MARLGELRHEPIAKRIRAQVDGGTVVDSTAAVLVWEPRRVVPSYAVPVADVRGDLIPVGSAGQAADDTGVRPAGHLLPAGARSLRPLRRPHGAGNGRAPARRRNGSAAAPGCCSTIRTWRGTSSSTSRRSTSGTRRTSATSPTRVTRSSGSTCWRAPGRCGCRSAGSWWRSRTVPGSCTRRSSHRASTSPARTCGRNSCPARPGRCAPTRARPRTGHPCSATARPHDLAWSYQQPLHDAARVQDMVAFFDERVDVEVDGEPRERPVTPWSRRAEVTPVTRPRGRRGPPRPAANWTAPPRVRAS